MKKNIGHGIETPDVKDVTPDKNCPFHSDIKVRGTIRRGVVVSAAAPLSATVRIERKVFIQKYKRYTTKFSKIHVHNPAIINAKVGDVVEFMGCRPISKTKSSTIVRVVESK